MQLFDTTLPAFVVLLANFHRFLWIFHENSRSAQQSPRQAPLWGTPHVLSRFIYAPTLAL